ncbi:unnamed protein product [Effrenium voratum]|uniref:DUF1736 domain-containing protein n=1 Tax=Effrenium voratum TaxID=2562239 RepID=A0AA36JR03_9DINO|nr:unnamed protein product [Effrenium voratum]
MAHLEESWARGEALLSLQRKFGDLAIRAQDGEVPASRLLLAAASKALAAKVEATDGDPFVWHWPQVPAAVARGIVAYSCGASRPFAECSASEAQMAWSVLRTGTPVQETEGAAKSAVASRGQEGSVASSVLPLCMVGASLMAYYPVVNFNMETGGFFMDDAMIRRNAVVVDEALDLQRLWRTDYWGLEMFDPNTWTHKSFRPFTVLTFRWNYLAHGFGSCGFHLTNALLHGLCSLQLGAFGGSSLRLPPRWAALLACLFAIHPVHTESICYVVGRADIICAQVLLLAMQFYGRVLSGGSWAWLRLLCCTALVVLAGLCKETGFTFFGLLVIWEVLKMRGGLHAWLRVLGLLVIGAAACAVRVWYTAGTQIARMDPYSNPIAASDDPYTRVLSYALVHGMYMKLLLWPLFLCYDYSMDAVPLVQSAADVRLLLPCAAYLGFLAAGCRALGRRSYGQAPVLGLAIFVLSFLPMTNILFPIGTLVAERLLYIPSMGFLVVLVCFAKGLEKVQFAVRRPFSFGWHWSLCSSFGGGYAIRG